MKKLLTTTALALTLAFAGVAYSHECWHDKGGHNWHHGHHHMGWALSKLPEKDADKFHEAMKQVYEKDKPLHEQMHKLHEELHTLLAAEKFDKDAFLAKKKELSDLHSKLHDDMTEAWVTAFAKLSPSERKTLTEAMDHKGHGEWHHEHHDEDSKKSGDTAKSPASTPAQ